MNVLLTNHLPVLSVTDPITVLPPPPPPLIRPPCLPPKCRHIRDIGLWREAEVNAFILAAAKNCGHISMIREGGLC